MYTSMKHLGVKEKLGDNIRTLETKLQTKGKMPIARDKISTAEQAETTNTI